ncbi:MAG TPA: restriction endonuclease [Candidatus Paceibacterota bacterium]|nr:restriction endonuclease [Candidatus Paceibacterota bacterium]
MWILIIIGIIVLVSFISWIKGINFNSQKYLELKPKLDNLESSIKKFNEDAERERRDIDKMVKQKSMGFPWLAEAFADYYSLIDEYREKYLINKSHPAYSSAEVVRIIKKEKRELAKSNKIISYKINYYEKLFPWLTELIAENEEDEIPVRIDEEEKNENDNEDRVKDFLTSEEYKNLSSVDRNQRALDRYLKNRNKSKWAIGRDYEMYVGYLFEQKGYRIEYKGIIDGFEDLGRDIIAIKGEETCIIQCKYWAQFKEIHEKHIFQLFGTTMEYWIKNFNNSERPKKFKEFANFLNQEKLRPIFFTSTSVSEKAKEMASALNIEIMEKVPIGEFPRIKCNISSINKEKIYHLPFDQQYDRTIILKERGENCVFTVKDAEDSGFRRAFKHRF